MSRSRLKKNENLLETIRNCVSTGKYRDTMHATRRQKERNIILPEILYVLNTGRHEKGKDRFDETFNTWNYAIRGWTLDKLDLRVVVSFEKEQELLIITAFYIEKKRQTK